MIEEQDVLLEDSNTKTSDISMRDFFVYEPNTKESGRRYEFMLPNIVRKEGTLQAKWIIEQNSRAVFHVSSTKYLKYNLKEKQENYRFYNKEGIFITDYPNLDNSPLRLGDFEDSENNDTEFGIEFIDVEQTKEIHKFLNSIKELDNPAGEIKGMKELYRYVINSVSSQLFITIDNTIDQFIDSNFSFQFHIAFLSITLNIKDYLSNRKKLISKALSRGEEELGSTEKALVTLDGLI